MIRDELMLAVTPLPGVSWKFSDIGNVRPASLATSCKARAAGCLLICSAAAASASSCAGSTPSAGVSLVTYSRPVVTVPVLSNTRAVILPATSRSATFLTRMPSRAAAEIAATIAVGVARMSAHGTGNHQDRDGLIDVPREEQTIAAIIRTVGTYHVMYRSMIRMIGILVCSAWTISDWTLPSVVSLPAFVTRMSSTPVRLFVPAKTCIPGTLSTGSDSPVMVASFTELRPFSTSPSAGTLSPGRTRMQSPGRSSLTWTSRSRPVLLEQVGPGRRQPDEGLDGGAGPQRRPRLHQLAEQHEKADQPGRDVLPRGEGRHDAERRQLIHVRFAAEQAVDRVDDDRRPEQDGPEHGEQLRIEAAGPVDETPDAAIDQQHAPGQRADQGDADAKLLVAGLLGAILLLEVQVLVRHNLVL